MTHHQSSQSKDLSRQVLRDVIALCARVLDPLRHIERQRILARAISAAPSNHSGDGPSVVLLMVYRQKNAPFVQLLLRQLSGSADVRLWALDETAPELAHLTLGVGPGVRFAHLNALYESRYVEADAWLIIADDDVVFAKGGLRRAMEIMMSGGISLAQPAQSAWGWWTSLFNVARPGMRARDTNYVEQGPVVIADPLFSKRMMPLPAGNDMGWGVEGEWYRLKEGRFRTSVIDECRMVHWTRSARSYAGRPEMERMNQRLEGLGIRSIWQLQKVNQRWWKFQNYPPWHSRGR